MIAVCYFADEGKMVDFGDDFEGQGKTDDIPEVVDEMTKTLKFSRRNFVEHVPNPHGGPDLEYKFIYC